MRAWIYTLSGSIVNYFCARQFTCLFNGVSGHPFCIEVPYWAWSWYHQVILNRGDRSFDITKWMKNLLFTVCTNVPNMSFAVYELKDLYAQVKNTCTETQCGHAGFQVALKRWFGTLLIEMLLSTSFFVLILYGETEVPCALDQ